MLPLFPFVEFVAWLAAATSAVMLIMLWAAGDVRLRGALLLGGWLLLAAYCQLFAHSAVMSAIGLILQTLLAVALIVWWRLTA